MPALLNATDRFDLVRLFLSVAETGRLSEAARTLGLSQPTASRLLRRLEALLGVRLVDRSPLGLSLTEAGQDFLAPARRLIETWHEAADAVRPGKATLSGTIRVAAPVAVGQSVLAAIVARFLREHPGLAVDWHLRDDQVDVTAEGYDLWIRAGDVRRDDLVVQHIYRVERAIVAAPERFAAVHPRELETAPAVRLAAFVPGAVELTRADGETFRLRQRASLTTDNLHAALTATLEGVGYAVLPFWCMHAPLAEGRLVRLCDAWRPPPLPFSLAFAPGRSRSPRLAALIERMRYELQDDRGLGIAYFRQVGAIDDAGRTDSVVKLSRAAER